MNKIRVINPEPVLKAYEDLKCGKSYVAEISAKDIEIVHEDISPLDGFEFPKNEITGKAFPFCCKSHTEIFKNTTNYLNNTFPNCCDSHKKLLTTAWFKKENYSYLPLKVVTSITYTFHCIEKCINNKNWYREITDYFDVTIKSYGQLPRGYGSPVGMNIYFSMVEGNINDSNTIPEEKKTELISYLQNYDKPEKSKRDNGSLNILIDKYQKWLKIFPFDLPFFSHLKSHFQNTMPILKGMPVTNLYSKLVGYELKTNSELISFLIQLTENIISEINSLRLFEKGLLTDIEKTKVEMINSNRRMELNVLTNKPNDERGEYIKRLKEWFDGEKKYLNEITPYVKKATMKVTPDKYYTEVIWRILEKGVPLGVECVCNEYNNAKGLNIKKDDFFNGLVYAIDYCIDNTEYHETFSLMMLTALKQVVIQANKNVNIKDQNNFVSKPDEKPGQKITIAAYALMHVYLSKNGGLAVTQQNKKSLAKQYGYNSGDQLRNEFTSYNRDEKRLDLHTTNKRAAVAHLERFKQIIPLLKERNHKACEQAEKDLAFLDKEYHKHY